VDPINIPVGITFSLAVKVGGQDYQAQSQAPAYVEIDSIGIKSEKIFSDEYLSVFLKFHDPIHRPNYYKYLISVNDSPYAFARIYSDKFNDGLLVSHDIANEKNDLKSGDKIQIIRQCVDHGTYRYWSAIRSSNPGNASPGNPPSNFSNGALGYFSVSTAKSYEMTLR